MDTETKTDDKNAVEASTTVDDKGLDSSTEHSQDDNAPKSLADVVRQTAEDKGAIEGTSPDGKEKDKPGQQLTESEKDASDKQSPPNKEDGAEDKKNPDGTLKDKKDEPTVDSLEVIGEKFKNNPGVQKLLTEYRDAKPHADFGKQVNEYISANRIRKETFDSAMTVAAMLGNDPAGALKQLQPIVERLKGIVGDGELPADLKQDVEEGKMTEEVARRIVRAEATQRLTQQTAEQTRQIQTTQANQHALNTWEESKRKGDSDFDKKFPIINAKFVELLSFAPAKNAAFLVTIAEKAYAFANDTAKAFIPPPPKRKVFKSNGSSPQATTLPKTLREVVNAAAAKHGG